MSTIILGVDPGETTGVFAFTVLREADVVVPFLGPVAAQIRGGEGVEEFVIGLLARTASEQRHLAVEQFVVGQRAARSRTPQAGAATRNLIGSLQAIARAHNVWWSLRPAATVKPWATDKRLDAAGLLAPTAGMRHSRDAARHALYAAVHAGLMRDPLSKAVAR